MLKTIKTMLMGSMPETATTEVTETNQWEYVLFGSK